MFRSLFLLVELTIFIVALQIFTELILCPIKVTGPVFETMIERF